MEYGFRKKECVKAGGPGASVSPPRVIVWPARDPCDGRRGGQALVRRRSPQATLAVSPIPKLRSAAVGERLPVAIGVVD